MHLLGQHLLSRSSLANICITTLIKNLQLVEASSLYKCSQTHINTLVVDLISPAFHTCSLSILNLPLHSQLRPYLHSDACSCEIHLRCRLIFQSPGSSATVSKRSSMEEEVEGKRRRRRRRVAVWVSGRLASRHRWRFVWILPRERGSRKREGESRGEKKEESAHTAFGFIYNC